MTIKLNQFDKKLLSNVKASDKWNKLKHLYSINSIVKQLKIGNNKIGPKCAKHLQKLSKKEKIDINEIKENCKVLIQKKQKHGLAKSKDKAPIEKSHKIDNTEKPSNQKIKPTSHKQPENPIDKLMNLLLLQQQQGQQQTIQRQIDLVDKKLVERNDFATGESGQRVAKAFVGAPSDYRGLFADNANSSISGLSEGERQEYRFLINKKNSRDFYRPFDTGSNIGGYESLTGSEEQRLNEYEMKTKKARTEEYVKAHLVADKNKGASFAPPPRGPAPYWARQSPSVHSVASLISDDSQSTNWIEGQDLSGFGRFDTPRSVRTVSSLISDDSQSTTSTSQKNIYNNPQEVIENLKSKDLRDLVERQERVTKLIVDSRDRVREKQKIQKDTKYPIGSSASLDSKDAKVASQRNIYHSPQEIIEKLKPRGKTYAQELQDLRDIAEQQEARKERMDKIKSDSRNRVIEKQKIQDSKDAEVD